jgi:adenosylcobinamide kinase/adenosylcobinamide-phosphate guanylyltransferase
MKKITLVTGGGRSGKSSFALAAAAAHAPAAFVATAQPLDREMQERIARHRQERPASIFTIEEPLDLAAALEKLPPGTAVAVIDCLAVWLGNLMHARPGAEEAAIDRFVGALERPPCGLIVVTNEVGMGIVPASEPSRRYRDLLGALNQRVAAIAREVVLMVSGLPLYLKRSDSG